MYYIQPYIIYNDSAIIEQFSSIMLSLIEKEIRPMNGPYIWPYGKKNV